MTKILELEASLKDRLEQLHEIDKLLFEFMTLPFLPEKPEPVKPVQVESPKLRKPPIRKESSKSAKASALGTIEMREDKLSIFKESIEPSIPLEDLPSPPPPKPDKKKKGKKGGKGKGKGKKSKKATDDKKPETKVISSDL